MKILLINPSCVEDAGRDLYSAHIIGPLFKLQPFTEMTLGLPLALPTLAAHTPQEHSVKIIDEEIEAIDFDEDCDLVGISAMTFKAKRAYEIAEKFRQRGVKVVIGGIHASMSPDEVSQHADAVVVGEGEDLWPQVLRDAEAGVLEKFYNATDFPDMQTSRIPRYELVKSKQYLYSYLQTSRGCPYDCSFCTVTRMNGRKLRKKTAEQVVDEVDALLSQSTFRPFAVIDKATGRRKQMVGMIAFIDDNFAIDREHALAVTRALRDYQEERGLIFFWYTQVNYDIGFDDELLSMMADANCQHLFIGFESLDHETLDAMNKQMNNPRRFGEAIQNIHAHQMRVVFSTIIGDDRTSKKSVALLKEFVEKNDLMHVLLNILTPYPGSRLYEDMKNENRLIEHDPQRYNIRNVVFQPRDLSVEDLEELYMSSCHEFFQFDSVRRRGEKLLGWSDRLYLPAFERITVFFGLLFTCTYLVMTGKLALKIAVQIMARAPRLILWHGSLLAYEVLVASADYDDFLRSEANRLHFPERVHSSS